MKKCLLKTWQNNWSATLLRVGAGTLMATHGIPKLLNFGGTIDMFGGMGIPAIIAVLVVLGESLGSIALILGFLTRFMAASLAIISGGIFFFHQGGYDMPILYLLVFISLTISGGGALALDSKLRKCCNKNSCKK